VAIESLAKDRKADDKKQSNKYDNFWMSKISDNKALLNIKTFNGDRGHFKEWFEKVTTAILQNHPNFRNIFVKLRSALESKSSTETVGATWWSEKMMAHNERYMDVDQIGFEQDQFMMDPESVKKYNGTGRS
jgi:hypothetical protein